MTLQNMKKDAKILRLAMAPWSCLVLLAVTVPYFLSKGLSLTEIFLGHSVLSITLALCDLPSGYLSDKVSRKATLLIAAGAKAMAGFCALHTDSLALLLVTYACIGVAISFFSGTDLAIIHDSYGNDDQAISQEMALLALIGNISTTAGILLGGIISQYYSLDAAALANALISCLPLVIFFGLSSPAIPSPKPKPMAVKATLAKDYRTAKDVLLRGNEQTMLLFALITLLKVPTIFALLSFQSIFAEVGFSSRDIGIIIGATYAISGIAAKFIPTLEHKLPRPTIIVACFAIAAASYLALAVPSQIGAIIAFTALELVKLVMFVYLIKEYNKGLASELRATLNSLLSLVSRIVMAVAAPLWGLALSGLGTAKAALGLGGIYLVISALVLGYFLRLNVVAKLKAATHSQLAKVKTR